MEERDARKALASLIALSFQKDPRRVKSIVSRERTVEFAKSLDLPFLIQSSDEEERMIGHSLIKLFLEQDCKVSLSELVGFDLKTRDILDQISETKLKNMVTTLGQAFDLKIS